MSIITDTLPDFVDVCGQKCAIHTDFRIWIKLTHMLSSKDVENISDFAEVILQVFKEPPLKFNDAVKAVIEFCNPPKKQHSGKGNSSGKRVYDYDYDAELIYAAFMQQYKIDLCSANLHWWQFRALFDGLTEQTHFIEVVQYRSADIASIKDKEQKKFYKKMKNLYRLPDNRTEKEKEDAIADVLSAAFM